MKTKKDCVEIPEEDRLALAKSFDESCVIALSEFVPEDMLKMTKKDGTHTMRECAAAFKHIDKDVYAWLLNRKMSPKAYYSAVGQYTVQKCGCKSLRQCRSFLKAIFRNPVNQKSVIAYINNKSEEIAKNKETIRSILLSISHLCDLTFRRDRVSCPSAVLQTIIDNGSLGRYLGGTLSYHFMALVPNIGEIIEKTARTQIDITNTKNLIMNEEYAVFYDSIPKYKQEAISACKCITGCPIIIKGVLPFVDDYYYKKYLPEHSGNATVTANV